MLTYQRLRPGLWAMHNGQIGIINQIDHAGIADFHSVDRHGETIGVGPVPIADLDMPTRDDIPAKRIENIHADWQPGDAMRYTDDYMAKFGTKPTEPTNVGRSNLEFVEPKEFVKFKPEHRASVAHVRNADTGEPHS